MRQACQCADRIGRGIEYQLGPLGAASVLHCQCINARFSQALGQQFDFHHCGRLGFEWPQPRLSTGILLDVSGFDNVAGRKGRATNHARYIFGDDFLVAHTILHGAHGGILKNARRALDRRTGMQGLCCDDAELARRYVLGIRRRIRMRMHIGLTGQPQPVRIDRIYMILIQIEGPDLDIFEFRQMGRK